MATGTHVDEDLWDEFHRLVNMSSRELAEWLRIRSAGEATDGAGTDQDSRWRHRLMSLGHDPLKPV